MKLEIMTERMPSGAIKWLVKLGRTHIGQASATPKPDLVMPEHIYIAKIDIAHAYQGRGFGKRLVKRIVRDIAAQPLPAFLSVEKGNSRARHIYAKMGGVEADSGRSTHVHYWWRKAA